MSKMIEGNLMRAELRSGDIVEFLSGERYLYVFLDNEGVLLSLSPMKPLRISAFDASLCGRDPTRNIVKVFRIPEDHLPLIDYIFGKDLTDWLVWDRKQHARKKAIADITQLIEDVGKIEKKLRDMLQ